MKAIFFKDSQGRLRCCLEPLGVTKPVESRDGRRYRWAKVFGLSPHRTGWPIEVYRQLQNAQSGETIELPPIRR